jgi:TusA-related sulfurtransferase
MTDFPTPHRQLDIRLDLCPMTFVRTRIELDDMAPGTVLLVLLRGGEPLENVTRACQELGHEVLARHEDGPGLWRLWIRRGGVC